MNKFLLNFMMLFGSLFWGYSQKLSSDELIKNWKLDNLQQTIEAEKTYTDLKYNLVPSKFRKTLQELNEYIDNHPSPRLEVRIKMYEILGDMEMNIPSHWKPKEEISKLFRIALLLKDNQLLSELYTLYADRNYVSIENRLFYLTKAIEIQSEIGKQYFPKFYIRQFLAGYSYFNIEQYNEAITNIRNCLDNLPHPETNLKIYILSLDMLGTLYDRIQKYDSSSYYYRTIHTTLEHYENNYSNFKEGYHNFDKDYYELWKGIADGGIGRAMVKRGKYEEGEIYLNNNIRISQQYNQKNDIAKALNSLALIDEAKKNYQKAISLRRRAYQNAVESKTDYEIIQSSKALETLYKSINRYDSSYYFTDKKYLAEQRLLNKISETKHQVVQNKLQHENLLHLIDDAEQIIKKQRNTRNFILIGIVLLLMLIYYFYKRNVYKQKLKILDLEKEREISELKLAQSQQEILEAKEQLEAFKNKLQHNQTILDNFSTLNSTPVESIPELQYLTILTKEDWENFKKLFNKVHPNYIYAIREKYPQISEAELRYICLVKLNLSQSEIASALGISDSSIRVTWHRMRKKFNIEKDLSPQEFLKYIES